MIALAIGITPALAQAPDAQINPIALGRASISGTVIDRVSKLPVENAMITLSSPNGRSQLLASTDRDGRYKFETIAGGNYRLTARHPEYAIHEFGMPDGIEPLSGRELIIVSVDPDQHRPGIDFPLRRGVTIGGRVTSHDGRPLAGATVRATLRRGSGMFSIPANASTRTNERGEYRISSLPEGEYDVSASWQDPNAVHGRTSPLRPIHYPGTARLEEATAVKVEAGAVVRDLDIPFPASELLRIQGQVVRSITDSEVEAFLMSTSSVHSVVVDVNGRFSTPRVPAGRYTLAVRARSDDQSEATWLSLDLSFELTDMTLALLSTGTIAGTVTTDDGSALPDMLQIAAGLTDEGKDIDPNKRDRTDIGKGGAFEIKGLFGPRVLRAVGVTEGWKIDRVLANKARVTSFDVQPGSRIEDVLVILKRQ